MKRLSNFLLAITLSCTSLLSIAQDDKKVNYGENEEECKKNLTIMLTYYKQKSYEDAARSFRLCLADCPESSKNIYIVGEKVMKTYIKKYKGDKELKSKYVDSLLMVYDLRLKYFPGNEKSQMKILENKGKVLAQYRINQSMEEAYSILDSVIDYTSPNTKSSTATRFMYVTKIMNKKNKLSCSEVITNYLKVTDIVNANIEKKEKAYTKLKNKAINYADACLECDLLDSLYSKDFEKNQNDTNWLDGGIDLLSDKKCTSSKILVKMMEKRFETSPAAKTAIVLAQYFNSKQQNDKAAEYFNKAIELQKDSAKLVKYYIKKAKFQNKIGSYSGARSTANKALALNPNSAKAYIIIGNAIGYSAGSCKDLKFGGAEVFWVAVDYYNKAAAVATDPEVKVKALKKAAKNSAYFPREQDIFLKTLNVGDSYEVGCWVNATTTIRAKK